MTGIKALLKAGEQNNAGLGRSMSLILKNKGMDGTSMFKTSFSGGLDQLGKGAGIKTSDMR